MAQQNFQNLSHAMTPATKELAVMPNQTAIDIGEQLLQIRQSLQQIQETLGEQTQQIQ
jgi:hypothetical protein